MGEEAKEIAQGRKKTEGKVNSWLVALCCEIETQALQTTCSLQTTSYIRTALGKYDVHQHKPIGYFYTESVHTLTQKISKMAPARF